MIGAFLSFPLYLFNFWRHFYSLLSTKIMGAVHKIGCLKMNFPDYLFFCRRFYICFKICSNLCLKEFLKTYFSSGSDKKRVACLSNANKHGWRFFESKTCVFILVSFPGYKLQGLQTRTRKNCHVGSLKIYIGSQFKSSIVANCP